MAIKPRWKNALFMSLLWVGFLIGTIYSEPPREGPVFFTVSASLILMAFGLIIYLGRYVPFAGLFSEEELPRLNVDRITTFIGVFFMAMSYLAFLTMYWGPYFSIPFVAFWIMGLYISIERGLWDDVRASV